MSTPPDDVTAVIAPQHEHARQLLEDVQQTSGPERARAFHALRLTLALHETAEEQAVHPQARRQLGSSDRAVADRIAEEQTAGQTIRELELQDLDSDQFSVAFGHLAASIAEHAAAEENHEWPLLQQITDPAITSPMIEQMQAVTRLADDPAAPGIDATFKEMQDWAKSRLPAPPST